MGNNSACKVCDAYLLEYLYGELAEKEKVMMDEHLVQSEGCRFIYDELRSIRQVAADQFSGDLPPGLRSRILGHAEEHQAAMRRRSWAWMVRPALTMAIVAIAATTIYRYSSQLQAPQEFRQVVIREKIEEPVSAFPEDLPALEPERDIAAIVAKKGEKAEGTLRYEAADEETPAAGLDKMQIAKSMDALGGAYPHKAKPKAGPKVSAELKDLSVSAAPPVTQFSDQAGRQLPPVLVKMMSLAEAGDCEKARQEMDGLMKKGAEEAIQGQGWMALARCYMKKGEVLLARQAAQEAQKIPAYDSEAEAFLESLPAHNSGTP